jgi:hypothetical protein
VCDCVCLCLCLYVLMCTWAYMNVRLCIFRAGAVTITSHSYKHTHTHVRTRTHIHKHAEMQTHLRGRKAGIFFQLLPHDPSSSRNASPYAHQQLLLEHLQVIVTKLLRLRAVDSPNQNGYPRSMARHLKHKGGTQREDAGGGHVLILVSRCVMVLSTSQAVC